MSRATHWINKNKSINQSINHVDFSLFSYLGAPPPPSHLRKYILRPINLIKVRHFISIELPLSIPDSERSYTCVLLVYSLRQFMRFSIEFWNYSDGMVFFVFHFITSLSNEINIPSIKSFTLKSNLKPKVVLFTTICEHLRYDIPDLR
jgi:hypothetical protein